jgi:hypothetical protein
MPRKRSKLERILNTAVTIAAIPVFAFAAMIPYRIYQSVQNAPLTQPYLEKNASSIEEEVEEFFDIDIEGYNLAFSDEIKNRGLRTTVMTYNSDPDLITVNTSIGSPFLERPDNWIVPVMTEKTIKGNFIHELGHDYSSQLKNGLGEELHRDFLSLSTKEVPYSTIWEGIAVYFAVSIGENKADPAFDSNPRNSHELHENYLKKLHYEHGRRIVTPILDTLGVEEGIKAILTNPIICEEELLEPVLYQRRIIESVE